MRRKALGADRCFYCPESEIPCLEIDHPVGKKRDSEFTNIVCRNCHRKVELDRDIAQLTKNGLHKQRESKNERFHSYLLLMALFLESVATQIESPGGSSPLIVKVLRSAVASLRHNAKEIPRMNVPRTKQNKRRKSGTLRQPK
jgi:hypothetical protein